MADLSTRDVVNETQSVGDNSPADVSAVTSTSAKPLGDPVGQTNENEATNPNALNQITVSAIKDDQTGEETASRSDTESRAEGSVAESKISDTSTVKRPAVTKPISFQKYIPKVIQNATKAAADKGKQSEADHRPPSNMRI